MSDNSMRIVHIDWIGEYKPGDQPPEGYVAWHEWAEVQMKAGLKSVRCGRCLRYKFPQQMSPIEDVIHTRKYRGRRREIRTPVCLECEAKDKEAS